GLPIRARPVGRLERCRRWCARNRAVAGLLAALALAVGLGVGGVLWFALTAKAEAEEAGRQKALANAQAAEAERQRGSAKTEAAAAERQRGVAKAEAAEADRQRGRAQQQRDQALENLRLA